MYELAMRVLSSLLDVTLKGASYLLAYYYGKKTEKLETEKEALEKELELRNANEHIAVSVKNLSNDELERLIENNRWYRHPQGK